MLRLNLDVNIKLFPQNCIKMHKMVMIDEHKYEMRSKTKF
jgi:hypothetical protein